MTLHRTIDGVIKRCTGVDSPLAIFREGKLFKVVFYDSVQTRIDIKNANKTGFITTIRTGVNLVELEDLLRIFYDR